jgi:hypothetical protein
LILLLLGASKSFSQNASLPNGIVQNDAPFLNTVFDNYGNKYSLKDIKIKPTLNSGYRMEDPTCNSGIFNLHFTIGSGMEGNSAVEISRRAVVCQVFSDLSNFINTPLHNAGNTNKVEIWVRDINPLLTTPATTSLVLGRATGFYCLPGNSDVNNGGIADNEIWKTIHTGTNSYANVTPPIVTNSGVVNNTNNANAYYHGMVALNFSNPNVSWNYNLSANVSSTQVDLYTVVLHEVTHALGLVSLIDANGQSTLGVTYPYYSRFDTFLRDTTNLPLISTPACSMYNNGFSANTSILQPNCTTNYQHNHTNCATAIKYVGTLNTIPVYNPACFEIGSSLSHLEDECFINSGGNTYGNDLYFVMSNGNGFGVTKRFLKPEEKNTLCDIGYNLKNTFGQSYTFNGTCTYAATSCSGISVAGTNDTGFVVFTNANISLSTILNNDTNASGFECLQDVYDNTTFLNGLQAPLSGTSVTTITFRSAVNGLHLLRYVPIDTNGQKGNITYIYVFVKSLTGAVGNECATASGCDLVINGGFEQYHYGPVDGISQFTKVCNWTNGNSGSADYYRTNAVVLSQGNFQIPINYFGTRLVNHAIGNAYAGIWFYRDLNNHLPYYEVLATHLVTPLQSNTTYQLKFDAALSNINLNNPVKLQAYLGLEIPSISNSSTSNLPIPPLSNGILLNDRTTTFDSAGISQPNDLPTTNSTTWDTLVYTFTTGTTANQEYLYIGSIKDPVCANQNPSNGFFGSTGSYYYIDNVSLVPLYNASIQLPNEICTTSSPIDLSNYLIGIANGGVFTGDGVTHVGTLYSFSPALAGLGSHVINYTSISSVGCPSVVLTKTILVLQPVSIFLYGSNSLCLGTPAVYTASATGGVWSSSNTSIATINPTTGQLTALQAGTFQVNYVVGICNNTASMQVTIIDPAVAAVFSFPTTICMGSIPPVLPPVSNNNIPGTWIPNIVNIEHTENYSFKPDNSCTPILHQTITVIHAGHLIANDDTLNITQGTPQSPSVLLNDTLEGVLLTSNYLGLTIQLVSTTAGITINQDGTLNIPTDLQAGVYHVKYIGNNTCLQSNIAIVTIIISNPVVDSPKRVSMNLCYSATQYTTTQSLLDLVTFGGIGHVTATTIEFDNITALDGYNIDNFTINPDGTITVHGGTEPGEYVFTYTLCPTGSPTGCADVTCTITINTTVRANADVYYYGTSGTYYGSLNPSTPGFLSTSSNILDNDSYAADCGLNAPNSFTPAVLGGNVSNLAVDITGLQGKFTINAYGIVNPAVGIQPISGSYPFTYTICDINNSTVCSDGYGWISVITDDAKMSNAHSTVKDLDIEKIVITPNPSDGVFTISFEDIIQKAKVEIYTLVGQKIYDGEIYDAKESSIDLSSLSSGTYLLKISNSTNSINKIIIKN